jgi:hypothetical protein
VFRVYFTPPAVQGAYTLTVGPDIADASGNRMNQNGVLPNGEAGDAFTTPVNVSLPDLTVVTLTPSKTAARWGETFDVAFTVRNIGLAAATPRWPDVLYLSRDAALDRSRETVRAMIFGEIPPGDAGGDLYLKWRCSCDSLALVPLAPGDPYSGTMTITLPNDPAAPPAAMSRPAAATTPAAQAPGEAQNGGNGEVRGT